VTACFISFEGIEGCGKTTQIARLEHYLRSRGHDVEVTREPGGTPIAEQIRRLLLDPEHDAMAPMAELLLYEAARAQHVAQRINPALARGAIVLCDRFADSTTAYQGGGRGLPLGMLHSLHDIATGGRWPDLTIVLDVPVAEGSARRAGTTLDRIELEAPEFHERVRQAFLQIARLEPQRVKVIDGAMPVAHVTEAIIREMESLALVP
jgi:dTMP kinase